MPWELTGDTCVAANDIPDVVEQCFCVQPEANPVPFGQTAETDCIDCGLYGFFCCSISGSIYETP